MGNMWEGGREREGPEYAEYCESRFLDANDEGRCNVALPVVGDVIRGGRGGWFGFDEGDESGDWEEVCGEEVSIVGDMTAAIFVRSGLPPIDQTSSFRQSRIFPEPNLAWPASHTDL